MRAKIITLAIASTIALSSCVKNDYYTTEPTPPPAPVGYQMTFNDDFNFDAHNWSFSDPSNSAFVNINGGTLNYEYTPVEDGTNTVAIITGANVRKDFLVQTRITSDNAMGLAFGVSNEDYGYSFFIDDQGYFALYKEGNTNTPVKTILDWQYSSAIQAGWNDIELEQVGNYWQGYANGTKLFEVPAQYLAGSKVGYIVLANTVGKADYLTVQW